MSNLLKRIGNNIIIGGSPSSGSTLLSLMIDSHPEMFCGPETNIIAHPGMWDNKNTISSYFELESKHYPISSGITWARPSGAGLVYHLTPLAELRIASKEFTSAIQALEYIMKPRMTLEMKKVACEKSPANVYAILPALQNDDSLKAILTIRNAPDVMRSLLSRKFSPKVAVVRWLSKLNLCREALERFGSKRVLIIKYENLIKDPLTTADIICTFASVSNKMSHKMVECKDSLRFGADKSVDSFAGVPRHWKHVHGESKVAEALIDNEEAQLTEEMMRNLNSIRLSQTVLQAFGAKKPCLNSVEVSELFGYKINWVTGKPQFWSFFVKNGNKRIKQNGQKPKISTSTKSPFYDFYDQLLG